jgi:hypothetical protein
LETKDGGNGKVRENVVSIANLFLTQISWSNKSLCHLPPPVPQSKRGGIVEAAMSNSLAPAIVEYLRAWMMAPEHIENPYPTEEEKAEIIASTGVDRKQLSCWFSNNRKRFWKPKVDEIRAQYGLAETDPFPPELLATATFYTPAGSEGMNDAGENNDESEPDNKHQKLSSDIVAV